MAQLPAFQIVLMHAAVHKTYRHVAPDAGAQQASIPRLTRPGGAHLQLGRYTTSIVYHDR